MPPAMSEDTRMAASADSTGNWEPNSATEAEIVQRAQVAVSGCNWEVGHCAALWTKRFAKGRTDGDFAALVGLSADQVYQRRRVWESFSDVYQDYPQLKWSHFYSALTWDDAAECLQWAEEVGASVAEMKAWRRALRGEDLDSEPEAPWMELPGETTLVREPAPFDADGPMAVGAGSASLANGSSGSPVVAGVARTSEGGDGGEYTPFRDGAGFGEPERGSAEREEPSPLQVIKRLTTTIERCHVLLTPDVLAEFGGMPDKVRRRFIKAVETLEEKTASIVG